MRLLLAAFLVMSAASPALAGEAHVTLDKGLDASPDAKLVVEAALPEIRACYEAVLDTKPHLSGHITVKLQTDAKGKAKKVVDDNAVVPFADADVIACTLRILRAAKLPKKATTYTFKVVFLPPSGAVGGTGGLGTDEPTGTAVISGTMAPDAPIPAVEIESTKGGLDVSVVRRGIRAALSASDHCYAASLAKTPGLAGTLVVKMTIGKDGKVTKASGSGFPDAEATDCIVNVFRGLRFSASKGTSRVTYPLTFTPPASP